MKNKKKFLIILLMFAISIITVGPFMYTLFIALKPASQGIYDGILPTNPTLSNFVESFVKTNIPEYFMNTLIVTLLTIPLNLIFSSLAGYALSRMDFKGRSLVLTLIISTMTVPFQLYMAPLFKITGMLNLRNSYLGLMVLQVSTAFGIYLMRQAFLSIPKEIEESAVIDGANQFQVWYKVALPLVKPTLISLAIYTFTSSWGAYLWPLLNTTKSSMYTLSVGLAQMSQSFDGGNIKLIAAASILITLPSLGIFIALQKYFIAGAVDAGVKG